MPHPFIKTTFAVLIALTQWTPLPAWSFGAPKFVIAPGGQRTYWQAQHYCESLRARLPTTEEAKLIYQLSLDPVEHRTRIANYDGDKSSGSFWTSDYEVALRIFRWEDRCPVLFEVFPPSGSKPETTAVGAICGRHLNWTEAETVCVIP